VQPVAVEATLVGAYRFFETRAGDGA
jgi:hypothetical protein